MNIQRRKIHLQNKCSHLHEDSNEAELIGVESRTYNKIKNSAWSLKNTKLWVQKDSSVNCFTLKDLRGC